MNKASSRLLTETLVCLLAAFCFSMRGVTSSEFTSLLSIIRGQLRYEKRKRDGSKTAKNEWRQNIEKMDDVWKIKNNRNNRDFFKTELKTYGWRLLAFIKHPQNPDCPEKCYYNLNQQRKYYFFIYFLDGCLSFQCLQRHTAEWHQLCSRPICRWFEQSFAGTSDGGENSWALNEKNNLSKNFHLFVEHTLPRKYFDV